MKKMNRYLPTVVSIDLTSGEAINRFMHEDRHVKKSDKGFVLTSDDQGATPYAFWNNVAGGSTVCKIGTTLFCESLDVRIHPS
jgi:hypothetical protein